MNSSDFKISVIIPVYKVEKYIEECVSAVMNQTYKNLEIVLVDDGSPDRCPQICDEFAEKDSRVKALHKINGGASSARNAGMEVITGDYFIFLDSDDYWKEDTFLEKIVNEKIFSDPDIIIFGYTKDSKLLSEYVRDNALESSICSDSKAHTLHQLIINDKLQSSPCNKLYKTSIIRNNDMRFIEGICSEDIDWTARNIIYANSITYYDDYFYFYRENNASVTHNLKRKNIIDLKNQIIRIVEFSESIEDTDYYEWYMNYCAYQYITFLNCVVTIDKSENISEFVSEMKNYAFLLKYDVNRKVSLVNKFYKVFGYKGMLKILKLFLKIRG